MKLDFLRQRPAKAPLTPPAAPLQRKSVTGSVLAMAAAGAGGAGMPRNGAALVRDGFVGNPIGFRSVKMIAEAAAALPLVVQDATCRYECHPVAALLAQPNAAQGRAELLEALYAQLLLTGNAYLEAVGGAEDARPLALHVLRSDRVTVIPGADGWPAAYEYGVSGRKRRFDMGGAAPVLCPLKSFHPSDDHYGLAPLEAAAGAVAVHNAASRWSRALLDNAARPSGAIVYRSDDGHGTMPADLYDRLVIWHSHDGKHHSQCKHQ